MNRQMLRTLPDAHAIAALLPHEGAMSLLDTVISCDEQHLRCCAISHRNPANPLRRDATLGAANLIEYAAQAMALHAALCALQEPDGEPDTSSHGVIVGVRGVDLHIDRIDTLSADLDIHVTLMSGDARSALYDFIIDAGQRRLANGRITVLLISEPRH